MDHELSSNMTPRFVRCSRVLLVLGAILSVNSALQAQQSQPVVHSNKEQDLRQTVSRALNSLGIFYFEKQESTKAIETLETALRYDPENAGIQVNLSMVYLEQKQFEKVIAVLGTDPKYS